MDFVAAERPIEIAQSLKAAVGSSAADLVAAAVAVTTVAEVVAAGCRAASVGPAIEPAGVAGSTSISS